MNKSKAKRIAKANQKALEQHGRETRHYELRLERNAQAFGLRYLAGGLSSTRPR